MEAPEKIYLTKNLLGELCDGWDAQPSEVFTNIEYTRTDAFIEKACEWLENNVEKYYYLDEAYDKVISIKNLNNDFKKYMKGG